MLRVGLTGNIASGKSSVAGVWRRLGAPVIEADRLAREVVEPGRPALVAVAEAFGPEILAPGGELDRARLREVVFRDPEARERLESILHPAIARLRDEHEARLEREGAPIVVHDIPLLYEVGMEDEFDVVVLVDAPVSVRRDRIVEHRGLAPEEAERMIDAQMPAEQKRGRADIVIENTGTLEELEAEAEAIWRRLMERAGGSG